jgi:hypothetical protein
MRPRTLQTFSNDYDFYHIDDRQVVTPSSNATGPSRLFLACLLAHTPGTSRASAGTPATHMTCSRVASRLSDSLVAGGRAAMVRAAAAASVAAADGQGSPAPQSLYPTVAVAATREDGGTWL